MTWFFCRKNTLASAVIHSDQSQEQDTLKLAFVRGATLPLGRSTFDDEADLIVYLKDCLSLDSARPGLRLSVRRSGRYTRVDAQGQPILTFGDTLLDLMSDESGRARIGGEIHDLSSHAVSRSLATQFEAATEEQAEPVITRSADTIDIAFGTTVRPQPAQALAATPARLDLRIARQLAETWRRKAALRDRKCRDALRRIYSVSFSASPDHPGRDRSISTLAPGYPTR